MRAADTAAPGAKPLSWEDRVHWFVLDRLRRMTDVEGVYVPLEGLMARGRRDVGRTPRHPLCADCDSGAACRRAWRSHLQTLREEASIHWHRCPAGKWCVLAPIMDKGQCRAACKVVAPGDMDERTILSYAELLNVLVENFQVHGDGEVVADPRAYASAAVGSMGRLESGHPLIERALDYIEAHLTDLDTSVARVAEALGVNTTYLAHTFAEHTGWRMGRYLSARRIALARQLIISTDWQIKKIAFASGHRNADWFSEVFRSHTGLTPSAYRRAHRYSH